MTVPNFSVKVMKGYVFDAKAVVLNPRGSVSQSQGFGGGQDTHSINMIRDDTLRLAIIGCR